MGKLLLIIPNQKTHLSDLFRGLTSVYRSKAGGQDLEDAAAAADDDDDDDDDNDDEINYRNNSHWKKASMCCLSNYVSYYDAASLYPSSGTIQYNTIQYNTIQYI
jgi:hypothetical protein